MDSGEVINGLNESWTFVGASVTEWMAGFIMFVLCSELVENVTRSMPLLMIVWVSTTISLAALRKKFPDEERGVRNWLMVVFGMTPTGLPAPAVLQPRWSGAPLRKLHKDSHFNTLELEKMFESTADELAEIHRHNGNGSH